MTPLIRNKESKVVFSALSCINLVQGSLWNNAMKEGRRFIDERGRVD